MRLGIMGGTFDPIHNAHLFIADAARKAARLDRVLFIPSGNPPHKTDLVSAEERFAMTEMATGHLPWAEPSRIETDRQGVIYTVDTLSLLKKERPEDELFVILGADALRDMPKWKEVSRAMQLCEVVAVTRPGMSKDELLAARDRASERTGAKVTLVWGDSPDISSSDIRLCIAKGEPLSGLVPESVARYIVERGLYT